MLGFPQAKTPQQLTDVSLALQSAMPKDFRRFLGSPGTLRAAMYLPTEPARKAVGPVQSPSKIPSFRAGDMLHMHSDNLERGQALLDLLKPRILHQEPLPYKQLTPEQQRKLVEVLTLSLFEPINSFHHDLLNGILRPHQRDIANADLSMKSGNALVLGTLQTENGRVQFSGSIYRVDAPSTSDKITFP